MRYAVVDAFAAFAYDTGEAKRIAALPHRYRVSSQAIPDSP
jgi:hypothetical protein